MWVEPDVIDKCIMFLLFFKLSRGTLWGYLILIILMSMKNLWTTHIHNRMISVISCLLFTQICVVHKFFIDINFIVT